MALPRVEAVFRFPPAHLCRLARFRWPGGFAFTQPCLAPRLETWPRGGCRFGTWSGPSHARCGACCWRWAHADRCGNERRGCFAGHPYRAGVTGWRWVWAVHTCARGGCRSVLSPSPSACQQFRCLALVVAHLQRLPTVSVPCAAGGPPPAHANSFGEGRDRGPPSAHAYGFGVTHTHGPTFSALQRFRCLALVLASLQRIPTVSVCPGGGAPAPAHANGFGAWHWCWPGPSASQQFRCDPRP